jgi:hypothetical protein
VLNQGSEHIGFVELRFGGRLDGKEKAKVKYSLVYYLLTACVEYRTFRKDDLQKHNM